MSTIQSSTEHLTLNADGASKDIKFQANGVEVASIDSSGNFTSTSIDATKLSGTVPNFTSTGIDDNATSNAITIDASEVVGIGVTTPSTFSGYSALQLGDRTLLGNYPNDSAIFCHNGYSSAGWKYIETAAASRFELTGGGHRFQVAPSGTADTAISWTTAMTINNNGSVLAPNQIYAGNEFNFAKGLSTNLYLNYRDATITDYRMYNGNAGWASVLAASFSAQSDYRLKENIVPMVGSIVRLKQLKPCNFNFKIDADPMPYGQDTVDGFLAHEVQTIVPECVTGAKDAMKDEEYEVTPAVLDDDGNVVTEAVMGTRSVPDYQSIDQSKLVPLLVASLQEAIARIEQLENA